MYFDGLMKSSTLLYDKSKNSAIMITFTTQKPLMPFLRLKCHNEPLRISGEDKKN